MFNASSVISSLYEGTMTVTTTGIDKDDTTGIESSVPVTLYQNVPCRLSYSNSDEVDQGNYGNVNQQIKVFCDQSYTIPAGSKIAVTQNSVTETYQCSGNRAVYAGHQEIEVKLYQRYA